jgi:small subunit ribosomal protein S16
MLKIKLARTGKRNQAHYRIVINEAKDRRDGSYVEMIGHYIPALEPKVLELNLDRYNFWISQGAQPTETVAFLAKVAKSGKGFPTKKKKPNKKAKLAKKEEADKKVEKNETVVEEKQEKVEKKDQEKTEKKEAPAKEKAEEKVEKKTEEKSEEKSAKK